jgi:hypothetical protein
MHELEKASTDGQSSEPIVERLQQCPEAFRAGEMLGRMFDQDPAGDEPYLPPPGLVMPLF